MTSRTWNYRIIQFAEHLALHEVHYRDGVPFAYTEEPCTFVSDLDEYDDIAGGLRMALRDATEKPVLMESDFVHD